MDGIIHIAGGDAVEITIADGTFTVSTKTLRDYAAIEAFILARRPDLYQETLRWFSSLPDSIRGGPEIKEIVTAAMKAANRARFAVAEEIHEYNNSISGGGHRLWLAIKDHHPDVTVERCVEIIARSNAEDIAKIEYAIDQAAQKEILKN